MDTAVTEALFYFLRFMKRLRLYVWSLLSVNFDDYATRLVADLLRDSDCVVEEMLRVKVDAFPERMFFVRFDGMYSVKRKNIDLRRTVG